MRIAMIGPFGLRPKGTMSARALPLARVLVKRGHSVKMILPPWDFPQDAGSKMLGAGVQIENIELPVPLPGLFHFNTTRRLVKCALDFQPDVVHCFKPKAYAGLSAWWLWQMKRTSVLKARVIVDTDDWEGAGGWNDFNSGQRSALSTPYSWPQKRLFAWQEQWGLTHNDGVTVASRALQSIVWSLGVKPERVAYIPNGVSNSETGTRNADVEIRSADLGIRNEPIRTPQSEFCILLYTRFFEFKVERVLEVLRRVLAQVPEAKLLVVGKGFGGEEEQLLKQAEVLGLQEAIEYAGWVDPHTLPAYFARTDVAVFPFDDTLINRTKCPVKLTDLLVAGVPVVADAVGQNTEYIRHNTTGLLVSSGDIAAMVNAIVELWRDPPRRAQLGANAARVMMECFSWDQLAQDVERIYGAGS